MITENTHRAAIHAEKAITGTAVEVSDMLMRLPKYDPVWVGYYLPAELTALHEAMLSVRDRFWALENAIAQMNEAAE